MSTDRSITGLKPVPLPKAVGLVRATRAAQPTPDESVTKDVTELRQNQDDVIELRQARKT